MGFALPATGSLLRWDAEGDAGPAASDRILSTWRVLVLCVGLLMTAAAVAGAWFLFWPATRVQTWIVADGAGPAGRAALADAALRLRDTPGQSAALNEYGDALLITAVNQDPSVASRQVHSDLEMVLNLPVRTDASPLAVAHDDHPSSERPSPRADYDRLQAIAAATDARAATVSASLTSLARDIAAGVRPPADRSAGRETLDKGAAALADLQLQRIQLLTRYQDDYPAVVALDTQIRGLRTLLQDETRQLDAASRFPPITTVDPTLAAERERLRLELVQLNDRRSAIGAQLAATNQIVTVPPPSATATLGSSVPPIKPAPVLIEAATTIVSGPDIRWIVVPAAAMAALMLSLLAWFKPQHQSHTFATERLLQRLETALLPHTAIASRPAEHYATLSRSGPGMMLPSSSEVVTEHR